MLGIGFLALFSLGLAGMMGGGDSTDQEQEQDLLPLDPDSDEAPDLVQDPEISLAQGDADPVAEAQSGGQDAQPVIPVTDEDETGAIDRPSIMPGTPLWPELAELPLEPDLAVRALDLATVFAADGTEFPDEDVIRAEPQTGDDTAPDYTLTPPQGAHAMVVEYDAETRYSITYSEETTDVFAASNSDVSGPEGRLVVSSEQMVDAGGNEFVENLIVREFDGATRIVMHVDESHVGADVAQIDLTNPEDSLYFYFTKMESNVHLFYDEQDTTDGTGFFTTRTLYVVETPLDVREVPAEAMEEIIDTGITQDDELHLIAEVHLGTSELILREGADGGAPVEQTIANLINDEPLIGTNFYWHSDNSETALAANPADPVPREGSVQTVFTSTASSDGSEGA